MKVRMLECEAGVVWPDRPAVYLRAGETHDVPDHVAAKWIAIGLAESLGAPALAVHDKLPKASSSSARRRPARDTEE